MTVKEQIEGGSIVVDQVACVKLDAIIKFDGSCVVQVFWYHGLYHGLLYIHVCPSGEPLRPERLHHCGCLYDFSHGCRVGTFETRLFVER